MSVQKKFCNDKSEKLFSILWSVFLTLKTSTLGFSRILTLNFGKTWLCRKGISLNGVNCQTNQIAWNIMIYNWVCIISDKLKDCLFFSVQCSDDLDFMEQINQELEEPTLSQEGVVKRSAITQSVYLFLSPASQHVMEFYHTVSLIMCLPCVRFKL